MEREASDPRVCVVCGERLGVYEPILAFTDVSTRRTSFAREPDLLDCGATLIHAACGPPQRLNAGAT